MQLNLIGFTYLKSIVYVFIYKINLVEQIKTKVKIKILFILKGDAF